MSSTIRQFENAVNLLIAGAEAEGAITSALHASLERLAEALADGDAYRSRNGVITSPGKFEGEPLYAPYFWSRLEEVNLFR